MGGMLKFMQADDTAKRLSSVLIVFADIDLFKKSAACNINGIGLKIVEQLFLIHIQNVNHDICLKIRI